MKKLRVLLTFLIGWPLSLVALFFVFKTMLPNFEKFSLAGIQIHFSLLLLSIGSFFTYFLFRSFFWKKLLEQKNHKLPLKEIAYIWGFSEIKRYIPGNIWSFISRAKAFSEKNVAIKTTLASSLIEAQYIIVATTIVSLFAINFIVYGILPSFPLQHIVVLFVFLATACIILCFTANQYLIKKIHIRFPNSIVHIFPHFSFRINLFLLCIETIAFFFFGLGTYFGICAFMRLYLPNVLTFIGFFVFSLLVGYASIITPMGLGVREAAITLGLSKYISLSAAGFAAIVARVVFVVSELLFLCFAYLWNRQHSHVVSRLEKFVQVHWQEILLGLSTIFYTWYFSLASFLRYDNFFTGRFDLGNMDQTVWNTIHGRIFQLTDPNGTDIMSRLAFHADFILVLISPLYLIWQSPKMLLLIQTVVLAAGALFVFLIAKKMLRHKTFALIFALGYLLNPAVGYTNLYDFHAITLATTFFLAAFYFFLKRNYWLLTLFLILAGITKEEAWIITALFGLLIVVFQRKKILGSMVFVISVGCFYTLLWHVIPHVRNGAQFALAYYSDFGSSPSAILKSFIFSPQKTIGTILQKNQLVYLFDLLFPLGFLSFLSPIVLIFALPDMLVDLLSNNGQLHSIYYQYSAPVTPFLFIAAIFGVKNILKKIPEKFHQILLYYLVITVVFASYLYGPFPGGLHANVDMFVRPQPYRDVLDTFLRSIPARYSVAATNNVGSHLSHRQKIFTIPVGIDKADIVVFLLNDSFAQPSLKAQKETAEKMKHDKNYIEVFKQGDFVVFEKKRLYAQEEPDINRIKLFPFSIPALQHRDYTGGTILIEKKAADEKQFTSYLISYPSDGLKIGGLMEIPKGTAPSNGFPVIILNHGFSQEQPYSTLTSYKSIADYFASNGFLVIKPDYRGIGNSESDNSPFEALAYSVDILNLLSSVSTIPQVNINHIFLWGHGLGGGVALKVLEIQGDNSQVNVRVAAAALWSPATNPYTWYQSTITLFPKGKSVYEDVVRRIGTPRRNPVLWASVSQLSYVDDVGVPVEIMHGTSDEITPYTSSIELYDDLLSFNKPASLFLYPEDNHGLAKYQNEALATNLRFFRSFLSQKAQ